MRKMGWIVVVMASALAVSACDEDSGTTEQDATTAADVVGDATTEDTTTGADATTEEDATTSTDTTTTADAETDATVEDTAIPTSCVTICDTRLANAESMGHCVQEGYFDGPACQAYCQGGQETWGTDEDTAFETCATTDPLCFQEIDQCMQGQLYGELDPETPVAHTVQLRVSGLDARTGQSARVQLSAGFSPEPLEDVTVDGSGQLEKSWSFNTPLPYQGYRIALFVDGDADNACSPTADALFEGSAQPRFGTDPLEYVLDLTDDDALVPPMSDSFCGRFD